ncbi:MAG: hemerythrin domain-containing protein [Myxococcales bacterium]|nr:hemerythrin domain-containing protein [Myxococcales bacterium]MCB9531989.1 hemerythrin domain-containing protein [Myxococcales bacterium]MCB9532799.1 hemerythrin domain-containing protein [Myxococcales bacterium]
MVNERTIAAYLHADHERLRRLLHRATAATELDLAAFADFRRGLLRHIGIEEKLLLPAARGARGGSPLERARDLRIDHAAITSLLVGTPDRALCREIEALLFVHDAKEEGCGGVYDECERLLSDDEIAVLAQRAAAFPAVKVTPYYDGPKVHRTAESALASARRLRASATTGATGGATS